MSLGSLESPWESTIWCQNRVEFWGRYKFLDLVVICWEPTLVWRYWLNLPWMAGCRWSSPTAWRLIRTTLLKLTSFLIALFSVEMKSSERLNSCVNLLECSFSFLIGVRVNYRLPVLLNPDKARLNPQRYFFCKSLQFWIFFLSASFDTGGISYMWSPVRMFGVSILVNRAVIS